tara:strand:+ start:203 stop:529 length:327 start_codon:yes stop_codon:yes gene_type:complete
MHKLLLSSLLCIIFLSCGNNPPFINSLIAEPQTVIIGGTVLLTCDAYDDEDTSLEYIWDCTIGTIVGEGNTATWIAPDETGVFSISCEIMDSNDGHVIETVDILVIAS